MTGERRKIKKKIGQKGAYAELENWSINGYGIALVQRLLQYYEGETKDFQELLYFFIYMAEQEAKSEEDEE